MSATRPRRGPGLAMSGIPRFRSGIDGIVWPPVPVGRRRRRTAALLARLMASERLPLAEIEAAQGAQLARLAAHHARHSPAFRTRLAAARLSRGALDSVAGLRALPPMSRRAAAGRGQGLRRRADSASATSRSGDGHDLGLHRRAGAAAQDRRLRPALGRLHDPRPSLARPRLRRPHDLDPADQSVVHRDGATGATRSASCSSPAGRRRCPGRPASRTRSAAIDRFQPEHLLCFPSNLKALADRWTTRPEGMPASIRHRAQRRRHALARPARPPRGHARPADRGQLLLRGGRHHRACSAPAASCTTRWPNRWWSRCWTADGRACAAGEIGAGHSW